jgi:stage V sporulation protein R
MYPELETNTGNLHDLAHALSLDYYPVDFEVVPPAFMMEIAVYGLPVRMPHWSFGVRYIYQLIQQKMGHSKIFEVVFPGNPNRAFLVNTNSLQENTLVVAHVLGHADFSKNNYFFKRAQEQLGCHIVETAATHAHRINEAIEAYGHTRVEQVLDAALAIEQHIDDHKPVNRLLYKNYPDKQPEQIIEEGFQQRFQVLPGEKPGAGTGNTSRMEHKTGRIPPHPEYDLLWFLAHYAPDMEDWERDIFLAVREESFYFHPVFECNIMNEGWASYWHATLLREADFLPGELYIDAMKAHSDVVRPYAGDRQIALRINPYHLGFVMWSRIIEERGVDQARKIMSEEADSGFIRNYLDADLAGTLGFFTYTENINGEIKANNWGLDDIHEAILSPRYHFGAPVIHVAEITTDGTLLLKHDYRIDGRGLDTERALKVLAYIHCVWRRPVTMNTLDEHGKETVVKFD